MAKLEIKADRLHVKFGVMGALASLRLPFSVPLSVVRGATVDPGIVKVLGVRSPGTAFPFVIAAGTYYSKGERQFVDWRAGQEAIVIQLDHEYWQRLIIGCTNAEELAQQINRSVS
jgi:hypothetical protein